MTLLDSYTYDVKLEWTGQRKGTLAGDDLPLLEVAPPPEFSGIPGTWTPEHLLVAATASCLIATFLAIAEISKLHVISYEMSARGRLAKVPPEGYRFTEIILAPEVGVVAAEVERARRLLEKAEKNCFVSQSLRATVKLEPRFIPAEVEASS